MYFSFMKFLIVLLLCFITAFVNAQQVTKVPRKVRGIYEGIQATYSIGQLNNQSQVDAVSMTIEIRENSVSICYENPKYCPVENGEILEMKAQDKGKKKTLTLVVAHPNSQFPETLSIYIKQKELIRQGIHPQPSTSLKKLRKK